LHVLKILKTSNRLLVAAPAKEGPDFVVVTEERNEKFCSAVLEDESEIAVAAAFEKLASQLADTKAAMHVGLTKNINQIANSEKTLNLFALWQFTQATDDCGVDDKKFTQSSS
jgi:hypothetical protein